MPEPVFDRNLYADFSSSFRTRNVLQF